MDYTDRELAQIKHAMIYTNMVSDAGAPGHSQFLLISKLTQHVTQLESALLYAYEDRNTAVQLAGAIAAKAGFNAGINVDHEEPEWPVLFIDLPLAGQVSWHLSQDDLIGPWPVYHPSHWRTIAYKDGVWDGHTRAEKLQRVKSYVSNFLLRVLHA